MKKNRQPFKEIIDLQSEYEDYKALCKNKSSKYTYYDEWKYHMFLLFERIPYNHLNNFKHFLDFYSFCENQSVKILLPTLVTFVPIVINTTYTESPILNIIVTVLTILFAAWLIIKNYFDYVQYAKFIEDVLKVFENYLKGT